MLDSGHSGEAIAKQTGVSPSAISKVCFKEHSGLVRAVEGHPFKLSPINICHAQHLIISGKAENAVQVTRSLTNIINQPLSPSTVCLHLKKAGMKAMVKSKCSILFIKHCQARLAEGGPLMMWGCMTWEGFGFATKIDGRMDGDLYLQILRDELQQTLEYYDLSPSNIF